MTLSLPNSMMPAQSQVNPLTLAQLDALSKEERDRQLAIVQARKYYEGDQFAFISARLMEILDLTVAPNPYKLFHLNLSDKVVTVKAERLSVTGFLAGDDATGDASATAPYNAGTASPTIEQTLSEWAETVWQSNRMDGQQWDIYEGALRDGEYFVIVDLDDSGEPRLTPHQRFVAVENGGDGYGCKAVYANDDPTQPMLYAYKRWTESMGLLAREDAKARGWTEAQIQARSRLRMTVYYPDRFEKFSRDREAWIPIRDWQADETGAVKAEEWPVPWVDDNGDALGIPVIHFRNRGMRCEIDSGVVAMQNLLNKTLVDLADAGDQAVFRIFKAFGFIPTTDGKALASDGSNRMKIKPNSIIGTLAKPPDAAFDAIDGAKLDAFIELIEKIMHWIAQAKDIPLSRFQTTKNIAAADTLKQQEAPLLAALRHLHIIFGDAWEDALYMARRLANVFSGAGLDETISIAVQWQSPDIRSDDRDDPVAFWQGASFATAAGLPLETYLERMGWAKTELAKVGTQKMAAINLQQEDVTPKDPAGNPIKQ